MAARVCAGGAPVKRNHASPAPKRGLGIDVMLVVGDLCGRRPRPRRERLENVFCAALPSQIRSEDFEVCRFHSGLTRAIQRQLPIFGNSVPRCKMKGWGN
jgi:hypothetical protein